MTAAPTGTLIVLHGYEDEPGRRTLVDPDGPAWRVVEPRGPVELAGGPAWFASDDDGPVEAQLATSVDQVRAMVHAATTSLTPPASVDEAASGAVGASVPVPSAGPVVVGGFSQGGAVALAAALGQPTRADGAVPAARPAGVFSVNGWLPHAAVVDYDPTVVAAAGTQVLVVASADDEVVAVQQGRSAARWLSRGGIDVTFVELPGGHAIGADALATVAAWLDQLA
jgi:predicted esterase